jgi:hypothetical protein
VGEDEGGEILKAEEVHDAIPQRPTLQDALTSLHAAKVALRRE